MWPVQSAEQPDVTVDLPAMAARVPLPDDEQRRAAQALLEPRKDLLGRLGELAVWLASVQGRTPARPFERVRLVVLGDAASAAQQALAALVGADVTTLSRPDQQDPAGAWLRAGAEAAGREIDAGADLLVLAGTADVIPASTVIALLANKDVAAVVGHGPGMDDRDWMRTCAAVRDTARKGRPLVGQLTDLLDAVGATDVAVLGGLLAEAAARRTPVVLDDLVTAAAALVAQRVSYRTARWFVAGQATTDPGHTAALERLRLTPVLDDGVGTGLGAGALLAVPHLQAAAMLLADAPPASP